MMLYKPLVSLFMVFAATSGVAASATPVRRGNGYYPPIAPAIPASECSASSTQLCCNELTSVENPLAAAIAILANPSLDVALNCVPIVSVVAGNSCKTNTVCCQNSNQNAVINFNCNPINIL